LRRCLASHLPPSTVIPQLAELSEIDGHIHTSLANIHRQLEIEPFAFRGAHGEDTSNLQFTEYGLPADFLLTAAMWDSLLQAYFRYFSLQPLTDYVNYLELM